jgi:hypothetical protein
MADEMAAVLAAELADCDRPSGMGRSRGADDFVGDRRPESSVSATTDKRLEDFVTRD